MTDWAYKKKLSKIFLSSKKIFSSKIFLMIIINNFFLIIRRRIRITPAENSSARRKCQSLQGKTTPGWDSFVPFCISYPASLSRQTRAVEMMVELRPNPSSGHLEVIH